MSQTQTLLSDEELIEINKLIALCDTSAATPEEIAAMIRDKLPSIVNDPSMAALLAQVEAPVACEEELENPAFDVELDKLSKVPVAELKTVNE